MRIRNRPHNLLQNHKKQTNREKRGENITYKKTSILTEAKQIKTFIETYKKIPSACTLDNGVRLSPYSLSYLMSELISNPKKTDYTLRAVIKYNTQTHKDTINEKVTQKDYLKMINNFTQYCNTNKRVPSYITTITTKTRVSFELFMYCLSKIVVYYANNNTLPNYCLFNAKDITNTKTTTTNTQKNNNQSTSNCTNPHNSKTGCDAMGQNNSYYCGVSALQKCLYKLGIKKYTQKQLASVCATTTAGTSHQGLRTGVAYVSKKENIKLTVTEKNFSDYTPKQIRDIICSPNKAIIFHNLYRLRYGHYEFIKAVNTNTNEFEVINSLGNKCNYGCFCGYIEKRSYKTMKSYASGISQPSLIIITKG